MMKKVLIMLLAACLMAGAASGVVTQVVGLSLDEGSGSTATNYAGADGTIIDTASYTAGLGGTSALEFNPLSTDTTGRVEVTFDSAIDFDGISLTGWVNNYGQTVWGRLWHGTNNWCMEVGTDDALWWWDPTAGDVASSLVVPQDGQYHFIGITADDAAVTFYVDDQVQVIASAVARQFTDAEAWFGGIPNWGWARPLHGAMEDIRLFDGALTGTDIDAIRAQGGVPEPATMALLGLGAILVRRRRS